MAEITDEYMRQMMGKSKDYSLVILKAGQNYKINGVEKIIFEHARRNFSLRADGKLQIICRTTGDNNVRGIGVFGGSANEVKQIMDDDPGVRAGVFIYEILPCRSFAGDCLK